MSGAQEIDRETARSRPSRDPRTWIAVAFLAAQLGAIVFARFDPHRYYCWAPHDQQTVYAYRVRVDGRMLTWRQARARYRDPWHWNNPRAAEHVIGLLRQYESTYGAEDGAEVRLDYRVNGGPVQRWEWPEP